MQKDPVCGKALSEQDVRLVDQGTSSRATKHEHEGRWYYFCGLMCRTRFIADPKKYLKDAGR